MARSGDAGPLAPAGSDLALALDAAFTAGQAALEWFGEDPSVRHKGPDQPVTDADVRADRILFDRLMGARPGYGWLSEEMPERERLEPERVWVVDPIDGTRSFIRGYREFSVSIGLVEGEEVVMGVVHNPASREVYWARRDAGAYGAEEWTGGAAGGRRLVAGVGAGASPGPDPGDGPSTGGGPDERPALLASRTEIRRGEFRPFEAAWRVVPLGSTAYKLAGVAAGKGAAYLSRGPKSAWDVAAGALIVEESGGRATDLAGERLRFDRSDPRLRGVVAAARPDHHRALVELASGLGLRSG